MIATLISDRLVLNPLSLIHCTNEYLAWMNNPEVYRYFETGGDYKMDNLRKYLESVEANPFILFWAIHLKENGKHIGNIKIDPINKRHGLGEYGIMMGDSDEWGKGYAKEASKIVINHCFRDLGLRKINLGVVEDNNTAVNLYKKLGFSTEGIYKDHGYYDGKLCNLIRMAIFNPVDDR
jgi:[ribosomal protein S5]-alanine N-acetyltransferase